MKKQVKKAVKKELPTLASELKKAIKEPKKAKKQVEKTKYYVHHICYIDKNNKHNDMLLNLNCKLETGLAVYSLQENLKQRLQGNYRCLVNWQFICETDKDTLQEILDGEAK